MASRRFSTSNGVPCDGTGGGFGGAASKFAGLSGFCRRAVLHAGMHEFRAVRVPERRHPAERPGQLPPKTCCSTFRCPMTAQPRSPAQANERLRDDKLGFRVDENSMRWGNLSAYYFFDDYRLNNPFPSGQGGATIPGFDGLNHGRAQLISLGDTKTFGIDYGKRSSFQLYAKRQRGGPASRRAGSQLCLPGFRDRSRNGGHLSFGSPNRRGRKHSLPGRTL